MDAPDVFRDGCTTHATRTSRLPWRRSEGLEAICCKLIAFFERSLILNATCLTLFGLFFLNDVKPVIFSIDFEQQISRGQALPWRPAVMNLIAFFERCFILNATCLTVFGLFFLNYVKPVKAVTAYAAPQHMF